MGSSDSMIAASLSAAVAGLIFKGEGISGKLLVLAACLLAALSYGPQKYVDPAFAQVWPAVAAAQIAMIALIYQAALSFMNRQTNEM